MRQIITFILAAMTLATASAYNYSYDFSNTPLAKALIQIGREHPEVNLSLIYNELNLYRTSASVRAGNAADAIRQAIDSNPVVVTTKGDIIYVEALQRGKHMCIGRLVNEQHQPVDATVMLLSAKDSTLVTYGITEDDGSFAIPVDRRELIARFLSLGFKDFYSEVPPDGNFGQLIMNKSPIALSEVTVSASGVTMRSDKNTIYVSRTQKERANNALNVISQASFMCPEIRVNEVLKTISIDGSDAILLINGVKRDMSYLNAINPMQIVKIEFVNHSDIRYGTPYIDVRINLAEEGGFMTLDGFADLNSTRETHQITGGYRHNNNEFTVRYDGTFRDNRHEYTENESRYITPEKSFEIDEKALPSPIIDREHKLNLGFTNMRSTDNMFMAIGTLKLHNSDKNILNYVIDHGADITYLQDIARNYKYILPSVDLYYRKNIGQCTLELNAVGSYLSGDFDRNITQSIGYSELNHTENRATALHSEAALAHKIKSHSLRYGLNYKLNHIDNVYRFSFIPTDRVKELCHQIYAYVSCTGMIHGLNYSAGLGTTYNTSILNRFNVRSGINLNKKIGKKWNLSYLLSSDPESPGLSLLTSVITPVNNYLYQTGNEHLKSELRINNRLNARYSCGKTTTSFSTSYLRTIRPLITTYLFSEDPESITYNHLVAVPTNGRSLDRYSLSVNSGVYNLFNIVSLSINGGWDRYVLKSVEESLNMNRWYLGANASAWYRNWSLDFFFTPFPSRRISGNTMSEDIRFSYISLGWKYQNLAINLTASNPFSHHGFSQRTWNLSEKHPESTYYYIKDQANLLSLNVRYSLEFGSKLKKADRSLRIGGIDDGLNSEY